MSERIMPERDTRVFDTGATRDAEDGKPRYGGFNSPLVAHRFGQYMHEHRKQKDGTLRNADNWKKGIPRREYLESLYRHFVDLWLHAEGYPDLARESEEEALCGILFNGGGSLHELLKEKRATSSGT